MIFVQKPVDALRRMRIAFRVAFVGPEQRGEFLIVDGVMQARIENSDDVVFRLDGVRHVNLATVQIEESTDAF